MLKKMKYLGAFFATIVLFFTIATPASAQIVTSDKLITVDLGKQMLFAWQDGKIQHQTKVSTGMNLTPTVKGSFKITRKYPVQDMRGPSPYKSIYPTGKYYIKNVSLLFFWK